jgi:hypothetical protein
MRGGNALGCIVVNLIEVGHLPTAIVYFSGNQTVALGFRTVHFDVLFRSVTHCLSPCI